MRQANGILQVIGEMVSIVLLALTGRFIGLAQTTLESATPLTVGRALNYGVEILSMYGRAEHVALLLGILIVTSLIRIGIAYANRSVLLALRQRAGIAEESLSWGQRAIRLPIAVAYRGLSGIATLVGAIALALCFRLFNPESPFTFADLVGYGQAIAGGISYGTVGGLFVLFALYGAALAIIGYVASPAILTIEEMANGCRPLRPRQPAPRASV